jgi:hypothetical protein
MQVYEFHDNEIHIPGWVHPQITTGGASIDNWPLFKPNTITSLSGNRFLVTPVFDTTWSSGWRFQQYTIVEYLSNYYEAQGSGVAGGTPPTHTAGTVSDGVISWKYLQPMTGNMHFYTLRTGSYPVTNDNYPTDNLFRPYSGASGHKNKYSTSREEVVQTLGVGNSNTTTCPTITSGSGSPESVITAIVGSVYIRTDGGAGTCLYIKESGTGNTGWVAK